MDFLKFAFSFLFVRNWHTGVKELSRLRVAVFCAGLFLLLLALTIVAILGLPTEYAAPTNPMAADS
ncbi:MAG: hypothetical protein ACOC4E_00505 [Patescibacteria group bacterium]